MSVIHAPDKQEIEPRMLVFIGALGTALLILLIKLWFIQVVMSNDFVSMAERSRQSTRETLAPRGLIYDRQKRLIAGVRLEHVIMGIPSKVNKQPWVIDKVAALLNTDPKKMRRKLDDGYFRPNLPTPIFVGAPIDIATRIAEGADDLPGISVDKQSMRYYPNTVDMAHILGYVWTPSPKDLERIQAKLNDPNRKPADYVGKQGIEKTHELDLMGEPGKETLEQNTKKQAIRLVDREPAVQGKKLILTIDRDLQKLANETLAKTCAAHPGSGGAVVMIEPKTGEVLCMASYPSYDAGLFVGGINQEDYDHLAKDPLHPFVNRAISSAYSPGSTFKVLTSIAAAKVGKINYSSYQTCPGYYKVGNKKWKCENHPAMALNYNEAFSKSCNTYFGHLADTVGRRALTEVAVACGFGQDTDIDVTGEIGGIVPTEEWWAKNRPKSPFLRGHLVNMGIGQGELGVTPLQMANLAALVANDGVMYQPHFVKATIDSKGVQENVQPRILHAIDLPSDFWSHLKTAMVSVVERGTAHSSAPISGLTWGGKTGSAEHKRGAKTHAWFIGVAPMENPQVAIVTMIEQSGHGGDIAAPVAAKLVRYWLKDAKASKPLRTSDSASPSQGVDGDNLE